MCEICSKLTIKTPEFNDAVLVSSLLTLKIFLVFLIADFKQVNFFWDENHFQCAGDDRPKMIFIDCYRFTI